MDSQYIKDIIDPLIKDYNYSHKPAKHRNWKIGYEIWPHKEKDVLIITVYSNAGNNSRYYLPLNVRSRINNTNNLQILRKKANDNNMGILMLSLNHYCSIDSAIKQIKINTKLIASIINHFQDFLASKSVRTTNRFITLHGK